MMARENATNDAPVITGCGALCALGVGRTAMADALAGGRCGIGDLVSFDAGEFAHERAAEIAGFDAAPLLRSPKNYLDRNSALGFAAVELAVRESGAALPDLAAGHGLSMGSMGGNLDSLTMFHAKLVEKGARLAPPFLFPHTYYNTTAGLLSIEYGLGGPHGQFCSGPAAGLEAVAWAAECLRRGRTEMMICGGVEAFSEWLFRVAAARGWLSPVDGGEECCRPFGLRRNGGILGEGAAALVLESAESARRRGANVLAKLAGWAAASHPQESMAAALHEADISVEQVDAVFAAAGGYVREDAQEGRAIAALFERHSDVPVVALKSVLGETLGAGGPLAVAAAMACLERGLLAGGGELDEHLCEPLNLVRAPCSAPLRTVLINSGLPGAGVCVSVVLRT